MAVNRPRLETLQFRPNGRVPNSRFPVLLYRGAVTTDAGGDLADGVLGIGKIIGRELADRLRECGGQGWRCDSDQDNRKNEHAQARKESGRHWLDPGGQLHGPAGNQDSTAPGGVNVPFLSQNTRRVRRSS